MANLKKWLVVLCVLVGAYYLGMGSGQIVYEVQQTSAIIQESQNWGLGFGEDGTVPTGNTSAEELAQYGAYYYKDTEEKELFLTFDAGFENGNTEAILDALKSQNVTATFFLVGNYLETAPDLVRRMVEEGHTVANHSYHHPDMTALDEATFMEEITTLETLFTEVTGAELSHYYRPPQGKYSVETLQYAQDLGYETILWSLAYVDWYEDDQPTKEEAFEKLLTRIHPGAIVLLHSTSQTNGEILEELIMEWKAMGYTIKPLSEL
ncbi:MAG: polysaccharide deacetylase family protein [Eubacteriales bacterium]